MLFERQRVRLTLLDALGGQSAPTDFQKLLFLSTAQTYPMLARLLYSRQTTPTAQTHE
jgi:hypothetical protein